MFIFIYLSIYLCVLYIERRLDDEKTKLEKRKKDKLDMQLHVKVAVCKNMYLLLFFFLLNNASSMQNNRLSTTKRLTVIMVLTLVHLMIVG
jgi:hypothetical protein